MENTKSLLTEDKTAFNHEMADQSVSHATCREQDLIPALFGLVQLFVDQGGVFADNSCGPDVLEEIKIYQDDDGWLDDDHELWRSDAAYGFLNETLWDLVNEIGPANCCFSSHEGDGSDFAYWSYCQREENNCFWQGCDEYDSRAYTDENGELACMDCMCGECAHYGTDRCPKNQ